MNNSPASNPAGSTASDESLLSPELREELALWRALKPYIGRCLTLNHDINNPLAGIIGYGEFMLVDEASLSDDQRGYLTKIMQCAERIRKLVDDLCREKIELGEKIDLRAVSEAFPKNPKKSD
jgi:signal transduction histidine kinase